MAQDQVTVHENMITTTISANASLTIDAGTTVQDILHSVQESLDRVHVESGEYTLELLITLIKT